MQKDKTSLFQPPEELKALFQQYRQDYVEVLKTLQENFQYQLLIRELAGKTFPVSVHKEKAVIEPIKEWMEKRFGPPVYCDLVPDPNPEVLHLQLIAQGRNSVWAYFSYRLFLKNTRDALLVKLHWG